MFVMTSVSSRVPHIGSQDLQRLRGRLPIIREAMDSVATRLSLLKDGFADNLEVFSVLEESEVRRRS